MTVRRRHGTGRPVGRPRKLAEGRHSVRLMLPVVLSSRTAREVSDMGVPMTDLGAYYTLHGWNSIWPRDSVAIPDYLLSSISLPSAASGQGTLVSADQSSPRWLPKPAEGRQTARILLPIPLGERLARQVAEMEVPLTDLGAYYMVVGWNLMHPEDQFVMPAYLAATIDVPAPMQATLLAG